MTSSLREAPFGCNGTSFAALRLASIVRFLLVLLACMAPFAAAQSITPGGPIDFGSTTFGTPVSRTLTFVATTSTTVNLSGVTTDGATGQDFQLGSNTCVGTILPPNGCSITIVFNPTHIGERHGALLISDSSGTIINNTIIYGVGLGAAFSFAPATAIAVSQAPGLSPSSFTAGASVLDGNGNLYFTDIQNGRILEQSSTGIVTSVATLAVTAKSGIAIAGDGSLYVAAGNQVYKFLPGATPTAIVTPGVTLTSPAGLALDGYGGLFIADSATGKIARYSITGSGTSYLALTGLSTPLSNPAGLGVDSNQTLYIVDNGNDRIVTVNTGTGVAKVLTLPNVILSNPMGVAVDAAGTVYIVDAGNTRIVEVTVNAVAFALPVSGLSLVTPTGIMLKPNGDIVVDDNTLGPVLIARSSPAINFPTPTIVATLDLVDDPISLNVQSIGNLVSQLVVPQTSIGSGQTTNPSISTGAFLFDTGSTCPMSTSGSASVSTFIVGEVCSYPIDFQPTQLGLNKADLVLQTTALGGVSTVLASTVPLTGNGISGIASFSLVAAPAVTTVGVPVSLTLTALNASGATAIYYVGTITFTSTDPTGVFLGGTTYQLTAADKGVLVIPAASGIQFNQVGTFTVSATDGTFSVVSNPVKVVNASTMSLTSSVNPSLVNQTTTFTATVAVTAGASTPTGIVSFYSNGLLIGTATLINGVAQLPYAFALPGTFPITAVYAGDTTTEAANAGPLSQVVLYPILSNATNFTSSVNPSLVGQSTTLALTLFSVGPTPTGTVQFFDNGVLLGTATVINGTASLPVSFALVGTHPLTAVYSGDSANAPYTSGVLPQVVLNPDTITLTSSVNPSLVNQSTTLTASVVCAGVTPTGTIKFFDGATLLGTSNLINGFATLAVPFTTVGIHPLTAVYSGDTNCIAGTSNNLPQDVVNPTTAVSFTSSINPSLVGQPTLLTLTLAGSTPAATGTVSFYDNGVLLGTGTVVNGVATLSVSFGTVGTHPLTAVYSGDVNNAAVSAGPLAQVVVNPTGFTLTSSINPSLVGQSTNLTASIAVVGASPAGTIQFYDGATLIGSGTVVGGSVTITVSFATVGLHPLTAVYSGDAKYASATTAVLQQDVVNPSTVLSFTSSVNPSLLNQSTVLTFTLANSPSATGTVNFYDNGLLIGTGTVVNGAATATVSFGALGTHPLTAVYSGDVNNAAASASLTQIVVDPNTLTLTSSVNPSLVNQPTTLTASYTVAAGTPTGTINFYDGATLLGSGTLNNGVVSILVSFSSLGIHPLTAVYSGDATFPATTSTVLPQDVVNLTSTASFTSSVNPSLVNQSTVLTMTLAGSTPAATGTVSFYDNGILLGTGTVVSGVATITTSFATLGAHPLTAVYSGDTNNAAVTASLTQIVVNPSTLTLTSTINPSLVGQSTNLKATFAYAGTSPNPTGTVQFYDGATLLGSASLSAGVATLPATFSLVGIHTLTAVYGGDSNYIATTSAPYAQDVVNPTLTGSVSFTSSVNPSLVGQSTLLTVTLPSNLPAPTGTVNFYDGGVLIGIGTVTNGVATLNISFGVVGTHPLTAVYSGDANNAAATVGPLAQVVVSSSAITLTSSINPSLVNTSTNLTATLGTLSGTPSGIITFYDGSTVLGAVTVVGHSAVLSVPFSTIGIHILTAVYSGNISNAAVTSSPYSQDVVAPLTATLTVSPNPVIVNQPAGLTATLTITGGGPAATGTVAFYDGANLLGTSPVSANLALLSASFALPGNHNLTCIYSGDTNYAQTPCNIVPEIVSNPSSLTLVTAINPSNLNQAVQISATVVSAGPTPTGSVTFSDGAVSLGTVTLSGTNPATMSPTFTTVGIHPLTAVYSGDVNTPPATSNLVKQLVLNPASITLTSTVNPVLVNASTTLTATVTSTTVAPTGTVAFFDGATPLGTANLIAGIASLPTTFSTVGIHQLTAVYSGDPNNGTVTSTSYAQDVVNPTGILLTSSVNPSLVNQSTRFTATVSSSGSAPTGTVSFFNGAILLGTSPLVGNSAAVTVPFALAGTYPITAVYSGDINNATITSAILPQIVLNFATIVLTTSTTPVDINNPTLLKAVVTSTGVTPTGIISFFDGASPIGDSLLVSGTATLTVSFTYSGTHQLTALYVGDPNTAPATSNNVAQLVTDFLVAPAANSVTSVTVLAGGNATYSLVLTPLVTSTLTSAVTFGVEGLPKGTIASFTPATAATGAGITPFVLTLTAPLEARVRPGQLPLDGAPGHSSRVAPIALALLLLPIALFSRRKRLTRAALTRMLLLVVGLAGAASLTGCISDSSSGYYGIVPTTYNFSVTATSGNLTRTTNLTLTIK